MTIGREDPMTTPPRRLALGSALAGALAACHPAAAPPPSRTAVKVATLERTGVTAGTRYSAHVDPASRVDLAFKVGGYVEEIAKVTGVDGKPRLLQEGDLVREGQALASVRKADYLQRLEEARAALEQARSALDQAQRDVDRDAHLVETAAISAVELEGARTRLRTAQAAVDGTRARVDQAATAVADTTLRAPLGGVVLKRGLEVGALAAPGTVGFTIADLSSAKVIFAVPDSALPRLRLGAIQDITVDAYPGVPFAGRISRVSPSADPRSRVFEAEVLVPNADGRLKAGTVASLSLDPAGAAPVAPAAGAAPEPPAPPLVPLAAIVRAPQHPGAFAVFVVEDAGGKTIARAREIELGEYQGRVIPAKKGLTGSERVVVLGAGLLSDGEAVEVIP
jgi:RND family efflux transporter MFP subunit